MECLLHAHRSSQIGEGEGVPDEVEHLFPRIDGPFEVSKLFTQLADLGDGLCQYIDSAQEAEKALVDDFTKTLQPIARDVKIQVEFDPNQVFRYRQLGYENRAIADVDFRNDAIDAGEVGAGHQVVALYELELLKPSEEVPLATVRLRYKQPDEDASQAFDLPVVAEKKSFDEASTDFQFASSVAQFGMLLRDSKYKGDANFDSLLEIAHSSMGDDRSGYRHEFVKLVETARDLQ